MTQRATQKAQMAQIIGLATAVPGRFDQSESASFAKSFCCSTEKEERVLEKLYAHAGINRRSSSLSLDSRNNNSHNNFYSSRRSSSDKGPSTQVRMEAFEKHALALARESTQAALKDAQVRPDEITHLVTVSCTGFSAPGFDIGLIRELCMNPGVQRTQVGFMGCHGAINGMRVASAIASSQRRSTVLLCATEVCSLHFQYGWSSDSLVANSLFSDGSAAAVFRGADSAASATEGRTRIALTGSGSQLIANTADAMQWHIGNNGFTMHLASTVPDLVGEALSDWLVPWLSENALSIKDIGGWAIHPGGPRLLSAVQEALSLSNTQMAPSFAVLKEFGNMSSPTVLFILDQLQKANTPLPYVILAFGPGLTIEALVLQ